MFRYFSILASRQISLWNKWGRGKNYKIETFTDVAPVLFSCATERSPSDLRIAGETFQSRVHAEWGAKSCIVHGI
jgi:hypothetical protein